MRTWLNTELTKQEYEKIRPILKALGVMFEPSRCGLLVHIEVYATNEEANYLNHCIDELIEVMA